MVMEVTLLLLFQVEVRLVKTINVHIVGTHGKSMMMPNTITNDFM